MYKNSVKKFLLYTLIVYIHIGTKIECITAEDPISISHTIGFEVRGSYNINELKDLTLTQAPYEIFSSVPGVQIEALLRYANDSIPFFQAKAFLALKKRQDLHPILYDFEFIIEKLTTMQAFDDDAQQWIKKTVASFLFIQNGLSTTEYDILGALLTTALRTVMTKWKHLAFLLKDTINETLRTGSIDIETRKKLEAVQHYLKAFNSL